MLPVFTDPINLPKVLALLPLALTSSILFFVLRNRYTKGVSNRIQKIQIGLYLLLGFGMLISGFLGSQNYVRVLIGTNGRNNGLIYYLSQSQLSRDRFFTKNSNWDLLSIYRVLPPSISKPRSDCLE